MTLHLAGFDIRSIETHHKASTELSKSPADGSIASRSLVLVRAESAFPPRPRGVVKPSKSGPYMGVGLYLAGFDIIPIAPRQDTSTELSVSGAGDARALRSLLPVSESVLKGV